MLLCGSLVDKTIALICIAQGRNTRRRDNGPRCACACVYVRGVCVQESVRFAIVYITHVCTWMWCVCDGERECVVLHVRVLTRTLWNIVLYLKVLVLLFTLE